MRKFYLGQSVGDALLPLLLPLLVTVVQALCWEWLAPFAWLAYLPAVGLAAWACGLAGGLLSLALSVAAAQWLTFEIPVVQPLAPPLAQVIAAALFAALALPLALLIHRARLQGMLVNEILKAAGGYLITDVTEQDEVPDDLQVLYQVGIELELRNVSLEINPFPMALFAATGKSIYVSPAFRSRFGLDIPTAAALRLHADAPFPVAGAPQAAAQLLAAGEGAPVLRVSDGKVLAELRYVHSPRLPAIFVTLQEAPVVQVRPAALARWPDPGPSATDPLPARADEAEPGPVSGSLTLDGLRCLVVDDNPLGLELSGALLQAEGVEVTLANSGAAALALLEVDPGGWQLVLLDLQMPGLDGYATARALARLPDPAGRLVIAATADPVGVDHDRLAASGIRAVIDKPVDAAALPGLLARLRGPASP